MSGMTYNDAGVDIELGDEVSEILYNAAKKTWINREGKLGEVVELFEDFSGLRAIYVGGLPYGTFMNLGFDGVGTKMELGERIGKHDTVAYDLFAMVCDDAVVRGAEPVIVGSILDVNSLNDKNKKPFLNEVRQLAEGYIGAAKDANVAVVNGEVAELGARVSGYGDFNYNWGAGVVWFANKERMFTGNEINEWDKIVGFKEEGFRSNGLSLVRKIMENNYGENWHENYFDGRNVAELALTPSKIYTKAVVDMFGGWHPKKSQRAEIHGIAHITGGGLPGKIGRLLKPSGLGFQIYNPFEPTSFMKHIQELGNVSDKEAYSTWNMGQGMVAITPNPEGVISIAEEYGIDAKEIGSVIDSSLGKTISSKGAFSSESDKLLNFD